MATPSDSVQRAPLILETHDITKKYGRRTVLREITLEVQSGEVLAVAGINGSGKTTLLKILAGLIRPTRGRVVYRQEDRELPPEERRPLLGYIGPDVAVYEELTAAENVSFFARVRGIDEIDPRAFLDEFGLGDRADDLVSEFSSGMRQRVKLACALLHRPRVLLLDEPGVTLDEAGRELVRRAVEEQRGRGITVIASNDPEEVAYGDRVLEVG